MVTMGRPGQECPAAMRSQPRPAVRYYPARPAGGPQQAPDLRPPGPAERLRENYMKFCDLGSRGVHVTNERAFGLALNAESRAGCDLRQSSGIAALGLRGVAMGLSQVGLPTRTKVDPAVRRPLDLTARLQECGTGRPRVVRMPSDWWDSPAVAACPLAVGAQSGRTARKFTRNTLKEWGLVALAAGSVAEPGQPLGLRLLRRTGEVMCAVLDPSDRAPVLRMPDRNEEAGRGLQMVDALSDVWGWSPVTGRGKAVWAILFCALFIFC